MFFNFSIFFDFFFDFFFRNFFGMTIWKYVPDLSFHIWGRNRQMKISERIPDPSFEKGAKIGGKAIRPLFRRLTMQDDGNDGFDVNPKRNEVVSGWLESVYNSKSTNRQNFIPLLSCEK